MKLLDLTLQTAAANLALDEALLECLDNDPTSQAEESLRLWEPQQHLVVIGRSSKVAEEVALEYCRAEQIDVLRRNSGGAAIVTGPGCLMYAVCLDLRSRPELRQVDVAHGFVLNKIREAVNACGTHCDLRGTSDLAIGDRKFSGNSLRLKKNALLYHGTLLNRADLDQIAKCLKTPPRQPDYRQRRRHSEFLINLNLDANRLRRQLARVWRANQPLDPWPDERTQYLVETKYGLDAWNFRH